MSGEPSGIRRDECSAFEATMAPAPPPSTFDVAEADLRLIMLRTYHVVRGWKLPTHPTDTQADLPALLADFEQASARYTTGLRAQIDEAQS